MKRFLLLILLMLPCLSRAQEEAPAREYVDRSGMQLPLLRAPVAQTYGFAYNGTYLADTLGFLEGTLVYEGKRYPGLLLNLDACSQHVLVRHPESPVAFDLGTDAVSEFTRGGRTFINLAAKGYPVPAGFYEVMEKGRGVLYRRVYKEWGHLSSLDFTAELYIGYQDPHYRRNLADYFEHRENWYLLREDGTLQRLKSKRKIRKAYEYVRQAH